LSDHRKAGYITALQQAAVFLRTASPINQRIAYERLDKVVKDGRKILESEGVGQDEVETWDTMFRIAFLLATVKERNAGLL
jgi:hypothetical protein